jgi:drug/metabolite transporter (DMT)-like permease
VGGHVGGDALVLLGTLFAALYVVLSSRTVLHVAPLPLAALQQGAGLAAALVLLAGVVLVQGGPVLPPVGGTTLAMAALSGVVQYALPFWFYLIGIRGLPVAVAGLFLTLIPVFGVGGAVLFLGEGFAPLQAVGAILTIGALVAVVRRAG